MVTARKRQVDNSDLIEVNCLTTDGVGDCVYVRNLSTGSFYEVAKADPSNGAKMPAVGVIVEKLDATTAKMKIWGQVKGLYSSLTSGRSYFVGSSGTPSLTPPGPSGPGARAYLQVIGIAIDEDVILLNPHGSMVVRVG